MKLSDFIYFFVAVLLAGLVDDAIHISYLYFFSGIAVHISDIDTLSYATKPLWALGAAIIYYLIGDRLYSDSRFIKGLILAVLVCLVKDGLVREPLMNVIVGTPILDSIYRESQIWLSALGMSFVLAFMIEPKQNY